MSWQIWRELNIHAKTTHEKPWKQERPFGFQECLQKQIQYALSQYGPTTFDLQAILQKHDNMQATSNEIVYKITYSQHLKLKKGK